MQTGVNVLTESMLKKSIFVNFKKKFYKNAKMIFEFFMQKL